MIIPYLRMTIFILRKGPVCFTSRDTLRGRWLLIQPDYRENHRNAWVLFRNCSMPFVARQESNKIIHHTLVSSMITFLGRVFIPNQKIPINWNYSLAAGNQNTRSMMILAVWSSSSCLINYRKTSSISRTKSQNINVSCILLQLSSLNPLKPGVELRMKM